MAGKQAMFDHARQMYGMRDVKIGTKVEIDGRSGVVWGHSNSGFMAKLDDGQKVPFHPTWETVYYHPDGRVMFDYRRKKK